MKSKQNQNHYPLFYLFIIILFFACNVKHEKKEKEIKKLNPITTPAVQPAKIDSQKKELSIEGSIQHFIPIVTDTSKKYIYLTFDDGPQHGTVACFDLCKKLGIKSTFFMVGLHASSPNLRNIVKEIKENYPQTLLANHSLSHANNKYHSFYHHEYSAMADLFLAQKVLKVPFNIIRLPGSNSWVIDDKIKAEPLALPVCKLMDSCGYNILGWDLEWDFNHTNANPVQSADKMIEYVYSKFAKEKLLTKNHLVILTHDRMFRNPNYTDSLSKFISILQKDTNYIFETVDHYPRLKAIK